MEEDANHLDLSMENLLSPFSYGAETRLPKTNPEVPGGMYLSGFISQDCTWGCCYNREVIQCFPVQRYFSDQHTSFANHSNFSSIAVSSSSYKFPAARIACATELAIHNPRTTSGTRKLLLGLSCTVGDNNNDLKGAVVIFDPIKCLPMKWIEIPEPVSCITTLSHFEEGGSSRPFFNQTMMAMVGIAAIGLRGGTVLIIDLGLDDPSLSMVTTSRGSIASTPKYRLLCVNANEYVIATKRHKAVSQRNLIALKFTNEPEYDTNEECFHFCKPNGESVDKFPKNGVAVTCIEYVPQLGALLIGFTCGGFQIVTVNNMELIHSSELFFNPLLGSERIPVPVFGFTFQQPVDDIRNFCYVWVMYGKKSAECIATQLELYQLLYEKRTFTENFGYEYEGLKVCQKRMSFPLMDDFCPNESESEDFDQLKTSSRPVRIWSQPDTDLMYCVWEVGRGGLYYMGSFDLNQWYSNRTMGVIFQNERNDLCPFWTALPVELDDCSKFVIDVRIVPKSLMRWESPHSKLDVHMYPASYSFRAVCLTNTGVSGFEHFGIQEKLIRFFLKDGASLMIEPGNVKDAFERFGLEPVFSQVYGDHLSRHDQDRFFILSVLLETRRTPAIVRLASIWMDGSYANVGCTIDLIIDWILNYMLALRSGADEHWQNMFDFSDAMVPPETVRFINFSNFAWTSLHRLLLTLIGPAEVYTVRRQELEAMVYGLGKLVQYSAALLMMYQAQLLPESDGTFIRNLTSVYEQRRSEAKSALKSCNYIDNDYKKSHPLMIDYLMEGLMEIENVREEWHVEEGEYCYPPQHIGYLMKMFMWNDADSRAISRVFMYFLMDLSFYSQNEDESHLSNIERKVCGDFEAVMESNGEEYQDVYALWSLDHGDPNEILVRLKENDRLYQNDGLPWCAAVVALTAAGYENDVAELLSKSCPHNLAKLLFSLMTSSSSKYASLADLMLTSNLSFEEDLLQEFFQISEKRERLADFISSKAKVLPERVKASMLKFLNDGESVRRLSLLLSYYIHTEEYTKLDEEFSRIQDLLRCKTLSEHDRKLWTFQQNYLNHVLTVAKGSKVRQFLRRESPLHARLASKTVNIRAIAAKESTPPPVDLLRGEPKIPPHLRRLKLNETLAQDPLSPLRRYAGRIHRAVTTTYSASETDEERDDVRSLVPSSRRSMRTSISFRRQSIVNSTVLESLGSEERLNMTARNITIDIPSLLKTPAIDHRVDRSRMSLVSLNVTTDKTLGDGESINPIPEPEIHSIMKENDPSKPRATKKMEIRFKNLSLSSNEDEKNQTIYEDAEDLDESNDFGNTGFEQSYCSARDSFAFAGDDEGEKEKVVIFEEEAGEKENSQNQETEKAGDESSWLIDETIQENFPEIDKTTEGVLTEKEQLAVASDMEEEQSNLEDSIVTSEQAEFKTEDAGISRGTRVSRSRTPTGEVDIDQIEEQQNVPEVKGTTRKTRSSRSTTPNREVVVGNTTPEKISIRSSSVHEESHKDEEIEVSSERRTRASRSRTPTREVIPDVNILLPVPEEGETAKKSGKSTRSMTPKRENVSPERPVSRASGQEESHEEEETVSKSRKRSRVSRSRTPTREVIPEMNIPPVIPEEGVTTRRSGRSTRSMTPSRETSALNMSPELPTSRSSFSQASPALASNREENHEEEEEAVAKPRKRSRVSRSKTPTREELPVLNVLPDIPEQKVSKRSSGRSKASTKEEDDMSIISEESIYEASVAHEESVEMEGVATRTRRKSRLSRSSTPTRELAPELNALPDIPEEKVLTRSASKSVVASPPKLEAHVNLASPERPISRTSTVIEDSDDGTTTVSRKRSRVSRSRTPTRELSFDSGTQSDSLERGMMTRRSTRSSRSTTPHREAPVTIVTPERPASRTSTSRSSTVHEETQDEDVLVKAKRTRVSRSRTPTREVIPDVNIPPVIPEEGMTTRKSGRSTRSMTPSREAAALVSVTPERPVRRSSISRASPARSSNQEESHEEEEFVPVPKPRKRSRVSRSKTPTREAPLEVNILPDIPEEKVARRSHVGAAKSAVQEEADETIISEESTSQVSVDHEEKVETDGVASRTRRKCRVSRSKTPTRDAVPEANELSSGLEEKVVSRRSSVSSQSMASFQDDSSVKFEITQEDLEEDEEEAPSTSQKSSKKGVSKARKRRMKYLGDVQELSTVVEETSKVDMTFQDASLFENTIVPPKAEPEVEPPKAKKIKGFKIRPAEEPEEDEQPKPTKRRKSATILEDLDQEDDDDDTASVVSTRSNASKRSTSSAKPKTTRKRGRPKKNA